MIDLPGIYSFDAQSLDEQVARQVLLGREADVVINVLDAANLERNLYLTVQLLEMGVPIVLALNMMDIARKRGISIDVDLLARKLGCPVVSVVAVSSQGIPALKQALIEVIDNRADGGFTLFMDSEVEAAVADIKRQFPEGAHDYNLRWLALKLLEGDSGVSHELADASVHEKVARWQRHIQDICGESIGIFIADSLEVSRGVFGVMASRFDGQAGAFAYLLFVLLYFPCAATIGAISPEAGTSWAGFVAFWTTSVAYVSATLFYQLARIGENPLQAVTTIGLVAAYAVLLFIGLRGYAGKRHGGNLRIA
ncbi:MAG: hypothetical protein GY815_06750 [Gammaproteobacteria bacterium]|nr:hypothetical protein [Gammaproteobacteria bacterium]